MLPHNQKQNRDHPVAMIKCHLWLQNGPQQHYMHSQNRYWISGNDTGITTNNSKGQVLNDYLRDKKNERRQCNPHQDGVSPICLSGFLFLAIAQILNKKQRNSLRLIDLRLWYNERSKQQYVDTHKTEDLSLLVCRMTYGQQHVQLCYPNKLLLTLPSRDVW